MKEAVKILWQGYPLTRFVLGALLAVVFLLISPTGIAEGQAPSSPQDIEVIRIADDRWWISWDYFDAEDNWPLDRSTALSWFEVGVVVDDVACGSSGRLKRTVLNWHWSCLLYTSPSPRDS